jgi:hypothetical protein
MPAPLWTDGEILAASDVNAWFVPLAVYKTADLARTAGSLTADPDLSVATAANATYMVEATLFYKGNAAGNNFAWSWSIPVGAAAGLYGATYIGNGLAVVVEADQWTDASHTAGVPVGAGSNVYALNIRGMLSTGSNAGNLTLNWTATTGTSTLTARSYITLQRIG